MDTPEVRYAWNGDVALAYQVFGEGPVDLLYLQGYCSHLDIGWESPYLARFLRGLASRARVIATDRRGWGLSDRFSPGAVPVMETLVDDLLVLMDASSSKRAVVFASWECGIIAMLFAATHPSRVAGLVLCDTFPTWVATDDTPTMPTRQEWVGENQQVHDLWGRGYSAPMITDAREREWFSRYERASVAPGAFIAEGLQSNELDARAVLASIHAPSLVIGLELGKRMSDPSIARLLVDRIPGAKLFLVGDEGDSTDIGWWHWYGRGDAILREVARLIEGVGHEDRVFDRALATVVFTDIVGSTAKIAELGDAAWKRLLSDHHTLVRGQLTRFRGVEVDTAGDGFFATFDGPARAVACARAIGESVRSLGLEVRTGVHTGEVEFAEGKVRGIAVHIGSRIAALAEPGQVLVSSTVKDLTAGSGFVFRDAGQHELKGVPDRWRLYMVMG